MLPTIKNQIIANLNQPLLGWEVQKEMSAITNKNDRTIHATYDNAKKAAVLIGLFEKEQQLFTIMIQRTITNVRDKHSGQISYPGGKFELGDSSLVDTAIRETHEEIGIPKNQIEILGALTELYIPVSNFLVQPFVAWIHGTPHFKLQEKEVVAILTVSIESLKNPETKKTTTLELPTGLLLKQVPYFNVQGNIVWGATAMITNEFLTIVP